MALSDHEFGGVSTDLKLAMVKGYLTAFTTALQRRFEHLWYIDAFAGTGERTVRLEAQDGSLFDPPAGERVERRPGSARIAIETNPPFDRIIFMDRNRRHCEALRLLRNKYPNRKIDIIEDDANIAIERLVTGHKWFNTRAVMFLDPYGMSVQWDTLKAIRGTKAIDVWYLVSLSGLFRQAARDHGAVDETKRAALTRMLGTTEWEDIWYKRAESEDLFGQVDETYARIANVEAIESFVTERLGTLFPKVLKPLRLNNSRGTPQFALFFAISNSEPQAIGLATKIANHILSSGRASHKRP